MCQIAAAEVSHLEIDVAQVKSGQIGATEIESLETLKAIESSINLIR